MYTKKIFLRFLSFILTIILLGGNLLPVQAQTTVNGDSVTVSFLTMGQQDTILTGPTDSWAFIFRLPADWSLPSDSVLHVNLNASTGITANSSSGVVGFLEVYLNETWLTTINLTTDGEYSVDIPIPSIAWGTTRVNASQELRFNLVDALRCDVWFSASATSGFVRGISTVVRSSSYIDFNHTTEPVSTDLTLLPYPVFQDTFIPDKALLVIPDQPTQGEMQAAMTISAVFGQLTNGRLNLQLITVSKLTDDLSKESNLLFVGSPVAFPQLASANLPAPFNGTNFDNVRMSADDGILQMVESPQNPSKVWLLVSGNSDAAIVKAAQAVGSNQIRPYGPVNLAVVTGIGPDSQNTNKTDFNFADLGYPSEQTYYGSTSELGVWFEMPSNQVASDGAYFEMVFTNSALLNFDESAVRVNVNDNLVGGLRFSDRTTSVTHWKFNIPSYSLHPGKNLLLLDVYLSGSTPCTSPDEVWFSIMPESLLHLPTSASPSNTTRNYDLTSYPVSIFSTFDQTALVLPSSDSFAWSVASKLVFDLGRKLGGSNINIDTYYADNVPDNVLKSRDLILVGRPSTMPVMNQLTQVMPAPFENGQDIAQEKNPQYSFTVTDNVPVGYIEVFSSPWDSNLAVLTVTGNMDQGLGAAANVLLTPTVKDQLVGNFIVALSNQIIVQTIPVSTTSITSPQLVVVNNQSTPENGQSGTAGKINISLPYVVLIVAFILAGLCTVVLLTMGKQEHHDKNANTSKKQNAGKEKDVPPK